jgi:hypothetical protein
MNLSNGFNLLRLQTKRIGRMGRDFILKAKTKEKWLSRL